MLSPWLFSIYMDGCMREMNAKVCNRGARVKLKGCDWGVVASLLADDTMLLTYGENKLLRVAEEFCYMCEKKVDSES